MTSLAPTTGALLDSFDEFVSFFYLVVQISKNVFKICTHIIKDGNAFIVSFSVQPNACVFVQLPKRVDASRSQCRRN